MIQQLGFPTDAAVKSASLPGKKAPFHEEQFTSTQWDSAQDKAKWANAMTLWAKRGFPKNGWRKGLYTSLHVHMYGHSAHYNQWGFYEEWFANIHRQLSWLQYAAAGGVFGGGIGDPAHTWSDVERAFSAWIRGSGMIASYQQLCTMEIESKERALLALLRLKYPEEAPSVLDDGKGLAEIVTSGQPYSK